MSTYSYRCVSFPFIVHRLVVGLFFCTLFFTIPAFAQDAVPGDACSTVNSYRSSGGVENSGVVYTMTCQGGVWVRIFESDTSGNLGIRQATPAAPLHVGGEILIGTTTGLACSSTTEGAIRYNTTDNNIEICNGTAWAEIGGGQTASLISGTVLGDGTVYAGLTGSDPMYVTRCDAGQTWSGSSCDGARSTLTWNDGSSDFIMTNVDDLQDGQTNTASLVTLDSNSGAAGMQPHDAAQYCDDLVLYGHSDWYLPAKNELNTMFGNRAVIGNFDESGTNYWSSSEEYGTSAWRQRFSDGDQIYTTKTNTYAVRCARR